MLLIIHVSRDMCRMHVRGDGNGKDDDEDGLCYYGRLLMFLMLQWYGLVFFQPYVLSACVLSGAPHEF